MERLENRDQLEEKVPSAIMDLPEKWAHKDSKVGEVALVPRDPLDTKDPREIQGFQAREEKLVQKENRVTMGHVDHVEGLDLEGKGELTVTLAPKAPWVLSVQGDQLDRKGPWDHLGNVV